MWQKAGTLLPIGGICHPMATGLTAALGQPIGHPIAFALAYYILCKSSPQVVSLETLGPLNTSRPLSMCLVCPEQNCSEE